MSEEIAAEEELRALIEELDSIDHPPKYYFEHRVLVEALLLKSAAREYEEGFKWDPDRPSSDYYYNSAAELSGLAYGNLRFITNYWEDEIFKATRLRGDPYGVREASHPAKDN